MKLNLNTKILPNYNPTVSWSAAKVKAEKKAAAEALAKRLAAFDSEIEDIRTITIGTTPDFVINLNENFLDIKDINQLEVHFYQYGKMIQNELLYFADNLDRTSEGILDIEDPNILSRELEWFERDSEDIAKHGGNKYELRKHHNKWVNPKFAYDKVLNHLTLSLTQFDTISRFKPTDWYCDSEYPYIKNNPSLVSMELKVLTKPELGNTVMIKTLENIAVADTLEHMYGEHVNPIVREKRSYIYYGGYAGDGMHTTSESGGVLDQLPKRVELMPFKQKFTQEILARDGLYVKIDPVLGSEGEELPQYACVMIPTNMHVKLRRFDGIKLLFGGYTGMLDDVSIDSETGCVIPVPTKQRVTLSFSSDYVIDPDGATEENPRGQYITWYPTSQFYGAAELLFQFEDIKFK